MVFSLVRYGSGKIGSGVKADAQNVTIATDQAAIPVTVTDPTAAEYETVAASQTAQVMGATGAIGDYFRGALIVPVTLSPGAVSILDDATSITIFAGGAASLSTLTPFYVPIDAKSVNGAWKVTTGTNLTVFVTGNFT